MAPLAIVAGVACELAVLHDYPGRAALAGAGADRRRRGRGAGAGAVQRPGDQDRRRCAAVWRRCWSGPGSGRWTRSDTRPAGRSRRAGPIGAERRWRRTRRRGGPAVGSACVLGCGCGCGRRQRAGRRAVCSAAAALARARAAAAGAAADPVGRCPAGAGPIPARAGLPAAHRAAGGGPVSRGGLALPAPAPARRRCDRRAAGRRADDRAGDRLRQAARRRHGGGGEPVERGLGDHLDGAEVAGIGGFSGRE